MSPDLGKIVEGSNIQFPFEQQLSLLENLGFLYNRFVERTMFFPPFFSDKAGLEMRDRYKCRLHKEEFLEPLKYWTGPDDWYLYGRCKYQPDLILQINKVSNSLGF